jgi:hypothetical protein
MLAKPALIFSSKQNQSKSSQLLKTTTITLRQIPVTSGNHGDRTDSPVGARLSEATSHFPQPQDESEEQQDWKGWSTMVQRRWIGLQNT